ncbi:hypothetical protein Q7A36_20035, partial [Paracraurococcus sp. LOR1-02]|nr:hypothetical protein [Paracraurococcus sp. LOR1-02]
MDQKDRADVGDAPVVSEGGRSPSTLSSGQAPPLAKGGAALGPLAPGQRRSAGRKREVLLRLMRERHLLSPHRARSRPETSHERHHRGAERIGKIGTTRVTTVRDGKAWLFGVVEHGNAEMLVWHVARRGTRYEAIQALGMAVCQQFGDLSAGAARGLAMRRDHGSN